MISRILLVGIVVAAVYAMTAVIRRLWKSRPGESKFPWVALLIYVLFPLFVFASALLSIYVRQGNGI